MALAECVQCLQWAKWPNFLPTMEALLPADRSGLRVLVLGADDPVCWSRLAAWVRPPGSLVFVSEEWSVRDQGRAAFADQPQVTFHQGALDFGRAKRGPFDVVACLWPMEQLAFDWLRQCAPNGLVMSVVQPVPAVRRWALVSVTLDEDGVITWPQLLCLTDEPTAIVEDSHYDQRWVLPLASPILTVRDGLDGYQVRLDPTPPSAGSGPPQPRELPAARWVTALDRLAHLVTVEYPTCGVPWTGLCGRRFTAAGDALTDHEPLCRACLAAHLERCRTGHQVPGQRNGVTLAALP